MTQALFGRFWSVQLVIALKMDPGTRKPIIKVVCPCLGYIETNFGGYKWTYVVTVTSDRVKIHPRDEFFDKFHIFHSVTGIFGENH